MLRFLRRGLLKEAILFRRSPERILRTLSPAGELRMIGKLTATRGQRLLFFTDLCFACCALLFYFLFEEEQRNCGK